MSTALYRRYRPETFAEVIGQEHVTGPLMQALRTGRVNHAYLFSGPRGCGKTTSARILARTLNCHRNTPEHPIDTPCGECPSCVDLARGGSGSLDVVEIDAASHGGVDDARELRERATFAPSRDRFKVFIIDEAHMVSSAGFNALLKIVEEPPEHVRFVFATTEPDKVIGTIRSRTHHYPFRLVPPDVLTPYLEVLCGAEGVEVGSGVLPLVVRAGGGSVRDTLSVLDQLIAGSELTSGGGAEGADAAPHRRLDYEQAIELLGFTHASLLDDVVDAVAARDGASLFRVVERVISTGHEPRRFVEDVLERFRDLIVLGVSDGEAVAALGDLPTDQLDRMRAQASALGVGELSRAADLTNAALTEMTGATSPRLHLELLCARLLLPGADDGAAGFAARLDRLERGWNGGAASAPVEVAAAAAAPAVRVVSEPARPRDLPRSDSLPTPEPATPEPATPEPDVSEPQGSPDLARSDSPSDDAQETAPAAPAASSMPVAPAASSVVQVESELVRRRWDEVLSTLFRLNKSAWSLVKQNATVAGLDGSTLTLSFQSAGLQRALQGPKQEAVEKAVYETLGFAARINAVIGTPAPVARPREPQSAAPAVDSDDDAPADRAPVSPSAAAPPAGPTVAGAGRADVDEKATTEPSPERAEARASEAADAAWLAGAPRSVDKPAAADVSEPEGRRDLSGSDSSGSDDEIPLAEPPDDDAPPWDDAPSAAPTASPSAPTSGAPSNATPPSRTAEPGRVASRSVAQQRRPMPPTNLVGPPLVAQMLGGTVIDEIVDTSG